MQLARTIGRADTVAALVAIRSLTITDTANRTAGMVMAVTRTGGRDRGIVRAITIITRPKFGFIVGTSTCSRGIMTGTRRGIGVGN